MKRVGPELKMPDLKSIKVPRFVSDLYYDLLDRRLLPLVGLVLVAIVAVPFLLGGGDENSEPAPPPEKIGGSDDVEGSQPASLAVVEAEPGLRDYRKRLSGRTPTDPFKQRFTGPAGEGGLPNKDAEQSVSTSSGGSSGGSEPSPSGLPGGPASPVESSPAPAPESAPPPSGGGDKGADSADPSGSDDDSNLKLYTFAVDVQITRTVTKPNGKKEKSGPELRRGVVPPAALPHEKSQAVTYMGISPKTRKPLLLVSDDVEAIYGEGKCLSGSERCQLLEVELRLPTTFVYGPTGARFKINVIKVEPILRGDFE